jgi:IS1 family transposase
MPRASTTSSWPFPPRTREVQVDEKWGFVAKKEASCDPLDPLDRLRGDDWDHTAVDPESRLLLGLEPGKRTGETCERLIRQVHGRTDLLITSDEHAPYETAIRAVYGVERPRSRRPGPGRPPKPVKVVPAELCYATVRKRREKGRVVEVVRTLVFGTLCLLSARLERSTASTTINTSFVERNNGTDRHRNARKRRKTCGFSKELAMHRASSYFIGYTYNFCWAVRTLRIRGSDGRWQARTAAMAAGLSDHVWSIEEWITYPAKPR